MSDTSVYGLIGLTEESVGLDRRIYTGLTSTDPTLAVSYNSGRVDVFLNGVKLVGNHSEMPSGTKDYTFTATGQGSSITLATGVALVSSDVVEVMGYVSNSANTVTTYNYTASDGDTAFTANNSSGDLVNVFLNGVLLDSSDYNLTTANTVTLGSGAAASDIVHIQVIGALDNSNFVPAGGGTFSGNVAYTGNIQVDDIVEKTSAHGVEIDGVTLKDGGGTFTGNVVIPDGGNIGSASDTDAISISSSGAVTLSSDFVPATPLSHRNLIINGAMQVWQRGTSSTALSNSNTYVPDRFNCRAGVGSGHTAIRSTDVPTTGEASFSNSLKFTVGTGASLSAGNGNNYLYYAMEGYDSNPTKIGTAYAKIMTISFWVKASVTGVYGFAVSNNDNARTYAGSYTVSSANTWEKHTITIPASGAGGTWDTTNGRAITLLWNWGAGSDFIASSASWATADDRGGVDAGSSIHLVDGTHDGATWYITGIQLELGSVATPFEHRSFGEELTRCERYYQNSFNDGNVPGTSTSNTDAVITTGWSDGNAPFANPFRTVMRSAPTVTIRARNLTTTGQVLNDGTARTASAQDISNKGVSYIAVTSGTANVYNAYSYELNAEL